MKERKIKVVFLIRSLAYGGAERQLVNLVKGIDKCRFDVTVITFYAGGYFEQELEHNDVRLIILHKRGRWDVLRFLRALTTQLKNLRPDVVYSFLVEPNLLNVLLKPLTRHPKVVWGIRAADMKLENYDWFVRLNFRLQRRLSWCPDLIVMNSSAGLAHHVAVGFPAERCRVIHGGIDTARFVPDQNSRTIIRREWGIAHRQRLIGLVARPDPIKGIEDFLRAASLLILDRPNVRFVVVGSGDKACGDKLRQLEDELRLSPFLSWMGARSDMPALYNAMDLLTSSSHSEGFPNSVAEAMSCGVPCVVTDVGDCAVIVGDAGILVPTGDPQALAAGWALCLDALSPEWSTRARARICDNFDISQMVAQTETILMDLATGMDR